MLFLNHRLSLQCEFETHQVAMLTTCPNMTLAVERAVKHNLTLMPFSDIYWLMPGNGYCHLGKMLIGVAGIPGEPFKKVLAFFLLKKPFFF